jgi:hypothetical protein
MKHIFKLTLLLLCGVCLFTACDDDRDSNPTLAQPTSFTLNSPSYAQSLVDLATTTSLPLTWSQPNYNYNAVATYQIQVGVVKGGNIQWQVDDNGANIFLATSYSVCEANIDGEEIAEAICKIDGFKKPADYVDQGMREIAIRVCATINDANKAIIPNTEILSNAITFKHMQAYNAVKDRTAIWVIGNCSGWKEPAEGNAADLEAWKMMETDIESKVWIGTFDMPDGELTFRFYSKLDGWDGGHSIGFKEEDQATDVNFDANGIYEGKCVTPGKGSWNFKNFTACKLKLTVDLKKDEVKFEKVTE